jgi:hypothetical protein
MKTGVAGARPLLERGPLKGSAFPFSAAGTVCRAAAGRRRHGRTVHSAAPLSAPQQLGRPHSMSSLQVYIDS